MGLKLGDISPVAGLLTGEGFTTNFGLLPAMHAKKVRDDQEEKVRMAQEAEAQARAAKGMKKGGKVKSSASSRGDGIARKGKTKGRFV